MSHLHQTDISKKLQEKLIEHLQGVIDDADLLVFSDFNYGCLPDELVCSICELAREKQLLIVADSQSSSQIGDISRYKNVDLLTPTEYEARIAMRDHNSGLVVLAETLRQKTESKNIIIKLGEEGVLIHASSDNDAGYATDRIAALNMSPKDVAGAGDSMLIVSAMALCVGGTIWESAVLGSLAASLQVGRLGNRPLNMDELSSMVII